MAGLGSFVGGFVDGVNTRQRWDDRIRQQGFEDEDREWARENQDWAREDRTWLAEDRQYTREERARLRAEQDRLRALEQAERDMWAAAFDAAPTPRSINDAPAAAAYSTGTGTETFPVNPSLSYGNVGQPTPTTRAPTMNPDPYAPPQPDGARIAPRSIAPEQPGPGMAARTSPAAPAGQITPDILQGQIDAVQDELNAAFADTQQFQNGRGGEYMNNVIRPLSIRRAELQAQLDALNGQGTGTGPAVASAPPAAPPLPPTDVAPASPAAPEAAQPVAAPPPRSIVVEDQTAPVSGAPALAVDTPPAAAPAAPPPTAPVAASPAAAASPGGALAANVASGQVDTSPPPGARSATSPQLSFGTRAAIQTGQGRPPEENYAVANMMDDYFQRAAPQVMEFYLRNGMVEKAQAFQTWMQDTTAQAAIADWSRGALSAAMGDRQGVIDNFTRYYNRIADGVSVVPEQTGFAENGGIVLTFRDDQTGETWSQTLENTDDLLQQGILALSPERMFELLYDQNVRAQEVEAQGLRGEQAIVAAVIRATGGGGANTPERVADIAQQLAETDPGFANLPPDEQVNAILRQMQIEDRAAAAVSEGRYADDLPVFE